MTFGVGVGFAVGVGVGFAVGDGVGFAVGVAWGVGEGWAVGRMTGASLGVGVGRLATITPPGGVGEGPGAVDGVTLGDGEADGLMTTDGLGDPLDGDSDGVAGDVAGCVEPGRFDGPPAIRSPSLGEVRPTASANVARTRFRRPRATTSRAR